ncbi:MAG: hypothetical protein HC945_02770 [Nitrosarchaeum sp.]|nr:hypothetical protein [Nitrosarchaeum sp.]
MKIGIVLVVFLVLAQQSLALEPELVLGSPAPGFEFRDPVQELRFEIRGIDALADCTLLIGGQPEKSYAGVESGSERTFKIERGPGAYVWAVECVVEEVSIRSEERAFTVSAKALEIDPVEKYFLGGSQDRWVYTVTLPFASEEPVEVMGVRGNDNLDLVLVQEGVEKGKVELRLAAPILDYARDVQYTQYKDAAGKMQRLYEAERRVFDLDADGSPDAEVFFTVDLRTMDFSVRDVALDAVPGVDDVPAEEPGRDPVPGDEVVPDVPSDADAAEEVGSGAEVPGEGVVSPGEAGVEPAPLPADDRVPAARERVRSPGATLAVLVVVGLIVAMGVAIFFMSRSGQVVVKGEQEKQRVAHKKVKVKDVEQDVKRLEEQTAQLRKPAQEGHVITSTTRRKR